MLPRRSWRPVLLGLGLAGACVATLALGPQSAQATAGGATVAGLPSVVWGAHRGGSLEAPDGTLAAARAVLASPDVQVLDLDVRLLADGTPVLMHDATVDRTTDGRGSVSAFSSARWAALRTDPASWFGPGVAAQAPPTVAQLLDLVGDRTVTLMELKQPEALDGVVRLVRERGLTDSVILQSNAPSVTRQIADHHLHAQLWRTRAQLAADSADVWLDSHAEQVVVDPAADPSDVQRLLDAGLPVWAYATNNPAAVARLTALGVTGFVSDDPAFASGRTALYPARPTRATLASVHAQSGDVVRPTVVSRVLASAYLTGRVPVTVSVGARSFRATTGAGGTGPVSLSLALAPGGYRIDTATAASVNGVERTLGGRATGAATFTVQPEDAQLAARTRTLRRGQQVHVGAGLLDSAASSYRGPRREAHGTVLGLQHARVRIEVRQGTSSQGRLVLNRIVSGVDDGRPGNGIGSALTAWTPPRSLRPGRYTLRVSDAGGWYSTPPSKATIVVR